MTPYLSGRVLLGAVLLHQIGANVRDGGRRRGRFDVVDPHEDNEAQDQQRQQHTEQDRRNAVQGAAGEHWKQELQCQCLLSFCVQLCTKSQ